VHLWRWRNAPTALPGLDCSSLSEQERRRADRMGNRLARTQYLRGRLNTRQILGAYLGVPPADVPLWTGPRGKPLTAAIAFNLTHSGDLSLLAVARGVSLGVDLEQVRPRRNLTGIAARMLDGNQLQVLQSLAEPDRLLAFYRCWTRHHRLKPIKKEKMMKM